MYFSLILIANKFYSILFLKINDQRLKDEEEKKIVDAAEKQTDEEKTKQAEAALYESVKSLEDRVIYIEVKEKNAREALEIALAFLEHRTESPVAAKGD